MKKLLTILLVLLVAGFVFAADGLAGDATLTLKSSVKGYTAHGFYAVDPAANASEVFTSLGFTKATIEGLENNEGGAKDLISTVSVDMNETNYTSVGYYSFVSNSALGVKIDISATSLALGTNNQDNALFVPYKLMFAKTDASSHATKSFNDGESAQLSPGSTDVNIGGNLFSDNGVGDVKWGTFDVQVAFGDASYSFPEGSYEAIVTATITTN